jgi:hypothetical protein
VGNSADSEFELELVTLVAAGAVVAVGTAVNN